MTQQEKILNTLSDGEWHCTSEFYAMYMADPRTIMAKLRKANKVVPRWCTSHKHDGMMKQWRLMPEMINTTVRSSIKSFLEEFPSVDRSKKEVDTQNALF